ncbi:MAG: hypothetical protein PVH93_06710 [Nitrosopumilaceae archaeon]
MKFSFVVIISITVFLALLAYFAATLVESSNNSKLDTDQYFSESQTKENISYIQQYSLPKNTMPNGILVDKEGMVWIPDTKKPFLIKFDSNKGRVVGVYKISSDKASTEYEHDRMVWSILENIDGSIWFSHSGDDPLWRFNPKTTKFEIFESPTYAPFQMKLDALRGDIWYTTLQKNRVGVVQQTLQGNFKILEFDIGDGTYPSGIFLDVLEDSVWISQISSNHIAKFSIIRDNNGLVQNITKILEIPELKSTKIYSPTDLLVIDDIVWTTEHGTSFITSYNLTSHKLMRYPTFPLESGATSLPFWLRENSNQTGIWFNEHTGGRIAFLNLTEASLTEYDVPKPNKNFLIQLLNIDDDPEYSNKVWFSEWNTGKIGVVDNDVPLPFELELESGEIVIDSNNNQNKTITFQLYKNDDFKQELNDGTYNTIQFKTAGSMSIAGDLVNMTSSFNPDYIDLNQFEEAQIVLTLKNENAPKGNHTILIGASNGQVTKSFFLNLEIK